MDDDFKSALVKDVRAGFTAEPPLSREKHVAWLRAELQKGLDSGVSKRNLQDIYDDFIARGDAA